MIALLLSSVFAQSSPSPQVYSTGFRARPGGQCEDRTAARKGECLDQAEILDLERAWGRRPARGEDREAWQAVSRLYARTWEDLARRWALPDVEQTIVAQGFTQLPASNLIWEQSAVPGGSYALPRRDTWLGVGVWFDPFAAPGSERTEGPLFPHVRYHGPDGQEAMPRTLRLAGRFATRLGFDGKRHDYDMMDADPGSSGPFFEQMFPYQRKLSATRGAENTVYTAQERMPLTDFRFPRHLHDASDDPLATFRAFDLAFADVTTDGGMDGARALAKAQFVRFQRVVSVAAAQYAMQDITRNQMRVLTALTAMLHGPAEVSSEGYARDLVAAARGETDTSEAILEQLDQDALSGIPDSTHIRYERLPQQVVEPWVDQLTQEVTQGAAFFESLNLDIAEVFPNILRPDRKALESMERSTRRNWLRDSVLPGNDRDAVEAELLRITLARMLEQLPEDRRNRIETWMLMDHALGAMATTFDDSRPTTPDELVEATTAQWQVVLALHGHTTRLLPQGLGAVDPTAICSTKDGLEGLDEPSFKRLTVDLLVAAPPGADLDTVLSTAGPRIPFQFVDDPTSNPPTLERLVSLGGGEDLYRLRWSLWSGWHLLWDLEPASNDRLRLVLNTAALCEDLVLTSPDLAPSLIRAGLLQANFRPTRPERSVLDVEIEAPTGEDAMAAAAGAQGTAAGLQGKLEEAQAFDPRAAAEGLASKKPTVGPSAFKIAQEDLRPEVRYLRDLIWDPLDALLERKPGLLFVADIGPTDLPHPIGMWKARTPYASTRGHTSRGRASSDAAAGGFVGAGWMWLHRPLQRPIQVAPAFAPKDTNAGAPRWTRRNTADFGIAVGAGAFPFRAVRFACPTNPAVDVYCDETNNSIFTEGFSMDLQATGTLWRHGRAMVGVDVGLEARLDVRHAGPSWFYRSLNDTEFNFTLRPAAGLVVGGRIAPRQGRLYTGRSSGSTWGTPRNDGPTLLGRSQHGIRGSVLVGPGFNGMEATLAAELWTARSLRRSRGKRASFSPYHPGTLLGPYARGQIGLPLTDQMDPERGLQLRNSWTAMVGLRFHQRLAEPAPAPPEIE